MHIYEDDDEDAKNKDDNFADTTETENNVITVPQSSQFLQGSNRQSILTQNAIRQ